MNSSGNSGSLLADVLSLAGNLKTRQPTAAPRIHGPQRLVPMKSEGARLRIEHDRRHPEDPPPRIGYSGTDIAMLQDAMAQYLGPFRLRPLEPGPFRTRLAVARSNDIVVASLSCELGIQAIIESLPDNTYFIMLGARGLSSSIDGGPLEPGSFIVGPRSRLHLRCVPNAPITLIRVSRRLIERAWRDQGGRTSSNPLRFAVPLSTTAKSSGIFDSLAATFTAACESGLLGGGTPVSVQFGRVFAQTLLSVQPHIRPQPVPEDEAPAPHRAGIREAKGVLPIPATVFRAMDFCRDNMRKPILVADIATAAGVSVRRLQAAFRIHVGTTPIEYVKRLRLAGVHADLQRIADGTSYETVSEVALRWGFTHLGRFSGTYRAEFGVLPSQTARRDFREPPESG